MRKSMHKQLGGTVLGFIIGLVVGLAIAVVVAIMITKTSTPFTNKLGLTKNGDAPTIQLTDPNKPLYGASVKEMMAAKQGEAATVNAANVANAANVKQTENKVDLSKVDNKFDTKVDSKQTTKPTEPVAVKAEAEDKFSYFLQVGAFRDETDADNTRAKLALMGIEAKISPKTTEADNLMRLRVGPFEHMDAMNRMRSKLTENNIEVSVIKTPK